MVGDLEERGLGDSIAASLATVASVLPAGMLTRQSARKQVDPRKVRGVKEV